MTRPMFNAPAGLTAAERADVLAASETCDHGETIPTGHGTWVVFETETDPEQTPYDLALVFDSRDYVGTIEQEVYGLECNEEAECALTADYVTGDVAEGLAAVARFAPRDWDGEIETDVVAGDNGYWLVIRRSCPHLGTC